MDLTSLPPRNARHDSSGNGGAAPMSEEQGGGGGVGEAEQQRITPDEIVVYRVYKERWFGLAGLMLMNIVISWGVRLPLLLGLGEMGLLIGF